MSPLPKSLKLYFIATAFVLVAVIAFNLMKLNQSDNETAAAVPLVRSYILRDSSGVNFKLTGTVHARVESNLGFRVPGKIIKRFVDTGQSVTKGQKLMEVDMTDLVLAQQAAQSAVAAAKAENIRALQDEKRQRALLAEQAVSQQEYDLAKAVADSTTAKLVAAEANARQAGNQVHYAVLKADTDGVIIDIPVDVGQVVAAGQTVISLAQTDTREAVVNLPEAMRLYANQATTASLYSAPSQAFEVKLRELSASADVITRTYQARYTLEGNGQSAPLGSTVTVSFAQAEDKNSENFQIPVSALHDAGNGSKVWIIDPSTSEVMARGVSVTALGEEFADVTGNLKSGERVVALGAHLLKEIISSLPNGYRIDVGGNIEESTKANKALVLLLPLMMLLTLTFIMLQVRSFSTMLMVFATAPLGLVGAVPVLLLFNQPFGFNAIVGLIGLSGILMRNTLILVDQIHHDKAAGLSDYDAIVESTVRRARPVILTAVAAMLAFIPLTLSSFWGALAFVLIGGVGVGTILTLLFLPALYALWFKVKPTETTKVENTHA